MYDWISQIKQYLPTKETIRRQKSLGPVRDLLLAPELWHFHRRAVSGAVFIGLFCAFLPIPFQMVVAGLLAVFGRCNVPIAVALVWITNPFTFAPIFFFAYKLGAWLLDMEVARIEWRFSLSWFASTMAAIGAPLLLGSVICGWVSGLTGVVLSRWLWRRHIVRRWRQRRERRLARRRARPSAALRQDSPQLP